MSVHSSSSSFLVFPEDFEENHDHYVTELKEKEERLHQYNAERSSKFEAYFQEEINNPDSIFNLPALKIHKFSHKKIKFSFTPSEIAEFVSERYVFIISLKYRMGFWMVKRDYLPVNCKWRIYKLFYTTTSYRSHFCYTDENVIQVIREIWKILCKWTMEDDEFRRIKCIRYRNGEDLFLDRDDEELFLSDGEVEELHRKRNEIWKRMLPPSPKPSKRLRKQK